MTMSKVQITLTRTNAVKPIRIHCSGVRCFQIIWDLAPAQPLDAGPVYRCSAASAFRNKTDEERGPSSPGANIRWPEFGFLPGLSVRPARFVRFLFQKPRQLETANVGAKMIRPPQKLIRTSGSASAENQHA